MSLFVNCAGSAGVAALVLLAAGCAGEQPARDAAADGLPPHALGPERHPEFERRSQYVAMSDGALLAVDLFLPAPRDPGARLPAILHQSRYWRGVELRWPLCAFVEPPDERAERMARYGYAWVNVDVRGSGASTGSRPFPWSAREQRDAVELVDWIVRQPWSNGRVGAEGESYSGTAAELLAVQRHPALRAVAPRFALFDAYTDVAFPGGVPLRSFTRAWAEANSHLDANRLPPFVGILPRLMVAGVRPVAGRRDVLDVALREHRANGDVALIAESGIFRDDTLPGERFGVEAMSPHAHRDALVAGGTPLLSWSGWFDSAFSRAAIERFRSVRTPGSRLILGPWGHGTVFGSSPTSPGPSSFDAEAELLRFFDTQLRGEGTSDPPPVAYYTLVEDRWKAADSWPPPAERLVLHLRADARLERTAPGEERAVDLHEVDLDATTGPTSRWDSLLDAGRVAYPDRALQDRSLLTYTSDPLPGDTEVTGHPELVLFVRSDAEDGAFFAYLEDVAADGAVTYVTEGMLRALQRGNAAGRSYRRRDARPLVPGEVTELRFELLPISYRFRAGHRLRLALAGADRGHFAPIPARFAPTWRVHRDRKRPSRLQLPVVWQAP